MEMTITFPGGARVDAAFDRHVVRTDQPEDKGGLGYAPAPFDYFLASIGTCAGFYVMKFLEQRGMPSMDASITLKTERDPKTKQVAEVVLSVHLPPTFPERYRKAILNAVNLCPVKKHLEHPPVFRTELEIAASGAVPA